MTIFWVGEASNRLANGRTLVDWSRRLCAHRWIPFGTRVEFRHAVTGRRSWCRVEDRGLAGQWSVPHGNRRRFATEFELIRCARSRGADCRPPRGWRWRSRDPVDDWDANPLVGRELGVSRASGGSPVDWRIIDATR